MADIRSPSPLPVEGDGISYSGIFWFVVILTVVTLVCQLLMFVLLRAFQHETAGATARPSSLAPIETKRMAQDGRVYPDVREIRRPGSPQPGLLVNEPGFLADYRARETEILKTYGWVDRNTGTIRIPIDRAKDLLIKRGLPVRGQ